MRETSRPSARLPLVTGEVMAAEEDLGTKFARWQRGQVCIRVLFRSLQPNVHLAMVSPGLL